MMKSISKNFHKVIAVLSVVTFIGLVFVANKNTDVYASNDVVAFSIADTAKPFSYSQIYVLGKKGNAKKTLIEYAKVCAKKYNVPESLILGLIHVESTFKINAVSEANAIGLTQCLPSTARFISNKYGYYKHKRIDLMNPYVNIDLGTLYFSYLIDYHHGNINKALSFYNSGSPTASVLYARKVKRCAKNIDWDVYCLN
jgi:soluble lytic murein transglycosylase-like protein